MVLSAAVFAAVSGVGKTFFEVEQTLLDLETYWINFHKMWQCNKTVQQMENWFLGHFSLTVAGIMLAYNQLLLFSQLIVSFPEMAMSDI